MNSNAKLILQLLAVVIGIFLLGWLIVAVVSNIGPAIVAIVTSALNAIQWIIGIALTAVIVALGAVATITALGILGAWGVRLILVAVGGIATSLSGMVEKFANVGAKIDDIKSSFTENARDTAIDAVFLAFIALMCGLVFYMGTGDFLKDESGKSISGDADIIKVLSVGAIFCALTKVLLMLPVRIVKFLSVLIFVGGVCFVGAYLVTRYNVRSTTAATQLAREAKVHVVEANLFVATAYATIIMLGAIALAYPFSIKRWKKMVFLDK
jgi:hypothetical protein